MSIIKTIAICLMAGGALTACSTSYHETVDQRLQGRSPDERRAVLAQECGQEIQKGLNPDSESNVRHFENMKKICEEMTGKKVPVGTK